MILSPHNIKKLFDITILLYLAVFSSLSMAGEKEDQIIAKAVQAYGGDKLLSLKSISYTDTLHHYFSHQSGHALQGPATQHFNQIQLVINIDYQKQQSELKRATELVVGYHDSQNLTARHRIFKDGKGFNVDHFLQEYQQSERIGFDNADLGYSRMLDPIIIKNLVLEKDQAIWADTAYIQGSPHDVLTVYAGEEHEYSVYIHKQSGLLSRMLQTRGAHLRYYDFAQYQQIDGITWAKQMFVATQQQPIYFTNSRELAVNVAQKHDFVVPEHYQVSAPTAFFDVSALTIRELAQGVYYAGRDWGYTLFIDAGDYYISAGSWGMGNTSKDWQHALDLLHQTTGNRKPVKQHLVSHHHTDHMSELDDVLEHGAKLLLHPNDVNSVRGFLNDRELNDEQLITMEGNTWLVEDKVMLFDAPNSQASHNLAIYLPEHGIVFAEDFFGSSFQQQHHSPSSWPHMDTYQRLGGFVQRLKQLGIEMKTFVSSHHGRVLNAAEINAALEVELPSNEVILQRLFATESKH